MATIHEDDIKKVALGFLRSYYKHRPRLGDMRTETNMRGEGGIIVDSYLSYTDDEGEAFIATAEATSVDTREEVKYSVQYRLLLWDSMVFGVLAGFIYAISTYFVPAFSMPGISPSLRVLSITLMVIALTVLYHSGIRPLRRYRYIYAIAQFKKYHADEQWVALAKAVFPMLDKNTYYRELKRQCTRFGFGLILVDNQMQARLVLSPSREEQFDRQREELRFLKVQKYLRLQELTQHDWKFVQWWNNWTNPYREHDYFRFKSGFKHQAALIGLGVVLISVAFAQELKRMPVYFPNESRYSKILEKKSQELEVEPAIDDPKPFTIPLTDSLTQEEIIGFDEEIIENEIESPPVKPDAEVMIYDPYNQTITLYDCERMYNFEDTKYIIEIGEYGNQAEARDDLEILGDAGIYGIVFWEACFSPNRDAFVMYLETMHNDLQEAEHALDSLNAKLGAVGLQSRIRPISPVIDR